MKNLFSKLIEESSGNSGKSLLKRIGKVGFWFFLIKGLLWLIIPVLIALGLFS